DGTWTAGSWESRTPPSKEPLPMLFGGGFYLFISKNAGIASGGWIEFWLWKLIQIEGEMTFKRG
ncbi:hypothetical protein ACIOBL_31140, partial [Paenibacillus taichungensis]|uniref:hypothetical protein n=1 Tax=Paenibacillus taichungensis TaxID=484184 RepID=UPI00381D597D